MEQRSSAQAASYIKEILQHEATRAEREAQPPKPKRKWAPVVLMVTLPLLLGLTGFNVYWAQANTAPAFTQEQDKGAASFAMYLVARQIEGFVERQGRLPTSMAEIDPDEDDVEYVTDGNTFVLSAWTSDGLLTYRRGEDLAPLAKAAEGLLGGIR